MGGNEKSELIRGGVGIKEFCHVEDLTVLMRAAPIMKGNGHDWPPWCEKALLQGELTEFSELLGTPPLGTPE